MPSGKEDPRVAGNVVLDTVLTVIAFVISFFVSRPHVPSDDPAMINLWGALTALCITGVFWMAWQMFKITLRAQRERERGR